MIYSLFRPFLFLKDAERAHDSALNWLEREQRHAFTRWIVRSLCEIRDEKCAKRLGNITFPNPIGLAAGFDKNGRIVPAAEDLGFGFIEIGTVTPKPQPGNPKPRLWRFPREKALVNSLGFPGEGAAAVARHLEENRTKASIPVGINLGKNFNTPLEHTHEDLIAALEILHPFGDFFIINVSSPNTPGLRDLQQRDALARIAGSLQNKLASLGPKLLLIKIAPDIALRELEDIVQVVIANGLAGLVVANTTTNRALVPRAALLDRGGLSGKPLLPRTLELVKNARDLLGRDAVLIASGGIFNGADAAQALKAGADLIEIYTALVYRGPRCTVLIQSEMHAHL